MHIILYPLSLLVVMGGETFFKVGGTSAR